MHVNQKKH